MFWALLAATALPTRRRSDRTLPTRSAPPVNAPRRDRTFVGKLERGETAATVDSVAIMCHALGTTLSDFFEPFGQPLGITGPRRRMEP